MLALLRVQKGREQVWAQERRIWALQRLGVDTTEHKEVLEEFRRTLSLFEEHYGLVCDRMQRLRQDDMPLVPPHPNATRSTSP